jgi:DNA-directed RNA polymerase subunit RPC12/RpoP
VDISFSCSKCGQNILIDETGAGSVVQCPGCSENLNVPSKSPSSQKGDVRGPVTSRQNPALLILAIALACVSILAAIQFVQNRKQRVDPKLLTELPSLRTQISEANASLEIVQKRQAEAESEIKSLRTRNSEIEAQLKQSAVELSNAQTALKKLQNSQESLKNYAIQHALHVSDKSVGDAIAVLEKLETMFPGDQVVISTKELFQTYVTAVKDGVAANQAKKNTAKQNLKTIREIETDQVGFVGKILVIQGSIKPDTYFNFNYARAQTSHFSFRVEDGTGTAHLYMERAKAGDVRRQLLDAGKPLEGTFKIIIFPSRFDPQQNGLHAELLEVAPPVADRVS